MVARRMDLELALRGKDDGASSMVDGVTQRLRMFKKEARAGGEKDLKKLLAGGPDSLLDFGGKVLGGAKFGLASMLIQQGASQLGAMAEKAIELKKELRSGTITSGELLDKLAGGVPILGEVWTAGRAVRELLTGEKADIEAINEEAARTKDYFDAWSSAAINSKRAIADVYAELGKRRDMAAVADKHPLVQERVRLTDELADMGRKEKEKTRDQKVEEGFGGNKDAVEALKKEKEQLEAAKKEMGGGSVDSAKEELARAKAVKVDPRYEYSYIQTKAMVDSAQEKLDRVQTIQARINQMKESIAKIEGASLKAQDASSKQDIADKQAALAKVNKEWKELIASTKEKSAEGVAKTAAEAARAELEAAGKAFDAEIGNIRDRASEEQAAALEAAKQRIKDLKLDPDSADAKQLMDDAAKENASIGARAKAEEAQARKRQLLEEQGLVSESKQKQLQAHGDMLGAQLEQIRSSYAERIAMAKTQAEKEALAQSQATDEAEARKAAAIEKRDRSFDRKRQLDAQQQEDLDYRAAESSAARKAAVRAQIEGKAADEIHQFQKVLDDKTASGEEKKQARQAIERIKQRTAEREKAVDDDPMVDSRRGVQATLLSDRYHGSAEQYASGGEPALAAMNKMTGHTVHLKAISDNIAKLTQKGIAIKGRSLSS